MVRVSWGLAACVFIAAPALAQVARPPMEVGLGVTGLASLNGGWFAIPPQAPGVNIRVTLPVSSRFALEGGLSAGSQSHPAWEGVIAYYSIQVKQTIVRDQGNEFQPFVTYGAVGEFEHKRFRPYDYPTGNGGIAHVPGYVANEFLPPVLAAIGAGFQQQMGSHMALRADVQLTTILWVPLGARVTASLTIPLGHYQRP